VIYILIGYMFLFIHRPFEVWPILATLRVERIYMIFALAYWAVLARKRWIANPFHLALFAFSGAVLLCWLLSPWAAEEKPQLIVENYFKQLVFYLLLVTSIATEAELKKVCTGFIAVMGLYMTHSFREFRAGRAMYRMGIDRMIGVDQAMSDPNTFGASIVYALPMIVPVWQCLSSKKTRLLAAGYVGISILCILLTGSRSAFLGVVALVVLTIMRTRYRKRFVITLLILTPLLWPMLPPGLQNRFYTIIDPSVGPSNAQTFEGRKLGWRNGLVLIQQFPLTGCGPGAWIPATGYGLESHQLYAQVMGEMGILGVLTFVPMVGLIWWNTRRVKALYRKHPEWSKDFLYYLSDAVLLGVILLLFEGLGGHNLYRFTWQWYGGFVVIARHLVEQRCTGPRRAVLAAQTTK
jgi:O-antigen ligase